MSADEFRAYAEAVFRRHNAIQNELMFLLPQLAENAPERHERLVEAEESMVDACKALVSAASQRSRGIELGLSERMSLPPKVAACDRATRRLERLVEDAD